MYVKLVTFKLEEAHSMMTYFKLEMVIADRPR